MASIDKMLEFMLKAHVSCLEITCSDGVCKYRGNNIRQPVEGQISEHQIRELLGEIIPTAQAEALLQNRPIWFSIICNETPIKISASQIDRNITLQISLPQSSALEPVDCQPSPEVAESLDVLEPVDCQPSPEVAESLDVLEPVDCQPSPEVVEPLDMREFQPSVDVSLFGTLVIALLATIVIFAVFWPTRNSFAGKQVYNLVYDNGELQLWKSLITAWVPPTEVFLAFWSGCILFLKRRKHLQQTASLKLEIIPTAPYKITPENVNEFIAGLRQLPKFVRQSFLASRVLRSLYHFRARNDRSEVAAMLSSQSEIDAFTVTSSYTMLRVFIWALPILGFIGTVIGVTGAVDKFSGLSSPDRIQEVLNGVTASLAGAFGTTLVALVLSLFVMIPTSMLQKSEQDMLNSIDEFCNNNLLRRLHEPTSQTMISEFEDAGKQLANNLSKQLLEVFPVIGEGIAKQFLNAAIPSVMKTIDQLHEASDILAQSLNTASQQWESLSQKTTAMVNSFEQVANSVSGLMETLKHETESIVANCKSAESNLTNTMTKVSECEERITQTIAAATEDLQKSENALNRAVKSQQETVKQFETHNDIRIVQKMLTSILNTDHTITARGQENDGHNRRDDTSVSEGD